MFPKVLIATDSSPASYAVVGCGRALQQLGVRECVLAQCFLIREHVAFPDEIRAHIRSGLQEQKKLLEKQGMQTTLAIAAGLDATEIPRIAEQQDCSLIAVGSRGHSFSSEILLGGTAAEIIHQARRPVLILRLVMDQSSGQIVCACRDRELFHHVLYPTDFSEHAEHAFPYVREAVVHGARRVTLLHVQEKVRLGKHLEHKLEEFNRIDRERLDRLRTELLDVATPDIEVEIVYGSATKEIVERTGDGGATLVVMGSHGRGFVSELFLGSVSHNVARHAKSSVLLIPAHRGDDE